MRMRLTWLAFLFCCGLATGVRAADPAPAAELSIFEDLIGTWDEVMTNKATSLTPKAERLTTVTKRRWALGGRFMQAGGTWQPTNVEFHHLVAYDPEDKVFRSWYFDARGVFPRDANRGTWDEKTRTITWTHKDEHGSETTGTHTIVDKDHHEWTMVRKSASGEIVLDFSGKCTRRKE